jgi:alpha-1,4-digalacturonate transport system substrate-binding protein
VIDDGFKRAAQLVYDWHKSGVMAKELWGSVSGTAYRGANDEFKNAQVVMYMSGSWQIAQFDKTVGNAFDWVAVPTPCGPANCSACRAAPGSSPSRRPRIPRSRRQGHGISRQRAGAERVLQPLALRARPSRHRREGAGLQGREPSGEGLAQGLFRSGRGLSPVAYKLQGYANNRIIFNAVISRVGQAISGETTLDEAYKRVASDIEQQIAERNKK